MRHVIPSKAKSYLEDYYKNLELRTHQQKVHIVKEVDVSNKYKKHSLDLDKAKEESYDCMSTVSDVTNQSQPREWIQTDKIPKRLKILFRKSKSSPSDEKDFSFSAEPSEMSPRITELQEKHGHCKRKRWSFRSKTSNGKSHGAFNQPERSHSLDSKNQASKKFQGK